MIAIIDYGMGNLHSVLNALRHLGIEGQISSDLEVLARADSLILPGVGAFPDAMNQLNRTGLTKVILDLTKAGKPMLGICLGMQLLFSESLEFGRTPGLNLIPGTVRPIEAPDLKIPHIGWNSLTLLQKDDPLVQGLEDGDYVYFVHSFRADTALDYVVAQTVYGEEIPALVKAGNLPVWGAQFHPEKSHTAGLKILAQFAAQRKVDAV
ncbi:MAG: imidazole glycerol phosphate synthase subunit HisH [Clostridia bacterium]|nr:imidazole glycerol phosphate synthase subunit HisH [Clostridia bacterium]